jgi:hypothetical protein
VRKEEILKQDMKEFLSTLQFVFFKRYQGSLATKESTVLVCSTRI